MVIKVSTLLEHNTVVSTDTAPTLGGPLNVNNYPITNGSNPVIISGNQYPITTGATGQVLTTNGFGDLYWSSVGSGTVTSVGLASVGNYGSALTIAASPVTSSGTITITPNLFTSTEAGIVPLSGGGVVNFLRADGTWAQPSGSGGGGVTSLNSLIGDLNIEAGTNISLLTVGNSITISSTGSDNASNILGGLANEILYQSAPNTTAFIPAPTTASTFLEWNGTSFVWVPAAGTGTVTSVEVTSPDGSLLVVGPSVITTSGTYSISLPPSGVSPATYGTSSTVGQFTVTSTGILTSASNIPIAITPAQAGLGNVVNSLQVINAGGAPSIQESTGVPSSVAPTGALYVDQNITNGNGLYFYNGTSWIPISQKLNLYAEKSSGFVPPSALANNSIALGEGAQSNAVDSLAIGLQSLSRIQGGVVQASGRFASSGDAQTGRYLVRNITTNNVPTPLYVDGVGGSVRLVLSDMSTWTFKITVTGHRTDAGDGHAGYEFSGVIYRQTGAATTTILHQVSKTVISESNIPWDVNVTADTTNGALVVTATGEIGKIIRWLALVETVEITN